MGYKTLKKERAEQWKRLKIILSIVGSVLLLAFCIFCHFSSPKSWKYYVSLPDVTKRKAGELRIHFLDVGQGDCTLIELPDGKIMLIDAGNGNGENNRRILRYLNALDIDEIDYAVVTHADYDHCGGMAEIFEEKRVLNAYLPTSFSLSNEAYARVFDLAMKENCKVTSPSRSVDLSVEGEAGYTLRFLYPYERETEDDYESEKNASSAVIWLDYQGSSAIFCGDAPSSVEEKLLLEYGLGLLPTEVDLSETEILKVGHHGSATSTSRNFVESLGVETAIVSCGENLYGHPTAGVLNILKTAGIDVYRTDRHGNVLVTFFESGEYTVK